MNNTMSLEEYLEQNAPKMEQNSSKNEIIELGEKIEQMEIALQVYKKQEEELKKAKEDLRQKMLNVGVKTWELNSGTKITAIEDIEAKDKIVKKFAETKFKEENPELYGKYIIEMNEKTSPRKGSLRITIKGEK